MLPTVCHYHGERYAPFDVVNTVIPLEISELSPTHSRNNLTDKHTDFQFNFCIFIPNSLFDPGPIDRLNRILHYLPSSSSLSKHCGVGFAPIVSCRFCLAA